MNIAQAREEILNTARIYLAKDEFGAYRIPLERQRPVFMLGAPGIGKTAIMEQVVRELGIGLVSYSMTHHTRQSAGPAVYRNARIRRHAVSRFGIHDERNHCRRT